MAAALQAAHARASLLRSSVQTSAVASIRWHQTDRDCQSPWIRNQGNALSQTLALRHVHTDSTCVFLYMSPLCSTCLCPPCDEARLTPTLLTDDRTDFIHFPVKTKDTRPTALSDRIAWLTKNCSQLLALKNDKKIGAQLYTASAYSYCFCTDTALRMVDRRQSARSRTHPTRVGRSTLSCACRRRIAPSGDRCRNRTAGVCGGRQFVLSCPLPCRSG